MLILERYVGRSFFGAALLAWLMLTFVLVVGLLVQVTNLISRGLKPEVVLQYVRLGIPETFGITIPLAVLVSALLVFGRLSADSEIAAMRACGINLLTIMNGPILAGVLLTAFCFYIQNDVIPPSHKARRDFAAKVGAASGLALLEPGRFIRDFRDMEMYFERKEGNWLHNIIITDTSVDQHPREVRAEKALVEQNGENLKIDFYRVRIDPISPDRPGAGTADRYTHVITNAFKLQTYWPQDKDRSLPDLVYTQTPDAEKKLAKARDAYRKAPNEGMNKFAFLVAKGRVRNILFEINRRFAFSCTPLCFILIGIPLGIRSHRRESTIGIGIALAVAFTFYLCQVAAEAAVRFPFFPAYILVWIPVAICFGIACWLIPKNQ